MGMIYINSFDSPKGIMIAMCDEELMGRLLREGKVEINLRDYGAFYRGRLVTEEAAAKEISGRVYSANVVGERSVGLLVKAGLVREGDIRRVEGVPYVHLFIVDKGGSAGE